MFAARVPIVLLRVTGVKAKVCFEMRCHSDPERSEGEESRPGFLGAVRLATAGWRKTQFCDPMESGGLTQIPPFGVCDLPKGDMWLGASTFGLVGSVIPHGETFGDDRFAVANFADITNRMSAPARPRE